LGTDKITNKRDDLESALFTYIHTRHLRKVSIEVYEEGASKSEEAVERFDLTFEVKDPDDLTESEKKEMADKEFNQYREKVMKQLQDLDSLPENVDYRILIWCVPVNDLGQDKPDVDGWGSTSARSTDNLNKKNITDNAIKTPAITADAKLWIR
jgi:hypothetical protein